MADMGNEEDPPVMRGYRSFGQTCVDDESCQERRVQYFEDVIESMGPPGRYQILQILMICTNLITVMFIESNYVFIGFQPQFSCSPVNETALLQQCLGTMNDTSMTSHQYQVTYEACDIRVTSYTNTSGPIRAVDTRTFGCLNGHDFTGGDDVSIVTEWDLVCGLAGIAEVAQSVIPLGWGIGIMIASILSDKFGRKRTIVCLAMLSFISLLASAFVPNIYVLILLRFFSGIVGPAMMSLTFVLGEELLVSKHREPYCLLQGCAVTFSVLLMCVFAYILRGNGWRALQLCLGIVSLCPLVLMYFVDESATWLYSKGKYRHVTNNIQKICRLNGLDFDKINETWGELLQLQDTHNKQQEDGKKNAENYNTLDIFRNKKLRIYAVIGMILCFTNECGYFGTLFTASALAGSLYLNTVLMALSEIPGFCVGLIFLKYRGRRFTIIMCTSIASVCLFVSTCLKSAAGPSPQQPIIIADTVFFIIGRQSIATNYAVTYTIISELFPTTLRSSGMGLSLLGSCLGGIAAPYLLPLHGVLPWLPGTILIALLVVSAILASRLPETKGKQLPSIVT